jgi:ferredoxin
MKVSADQERCIGSGQCVLVAPDVFDQRESDGIVELQQDTPPADLHDDIREATRLCPAQAIRLDQP